MVNRITFVLFLALFSFFEGSGQKELGHVEWLRNYNEAVSLAKESNKPILILFQEVPGCATCQNYGKEVLSHPLIVDAIDNEFVPLAIYNNNKGSDAKILKKYNEPAWNNPVVRIVNADGENIIDRLSGNYSAYGLVLQMSLALRQAGKGLPKYLDLLTEELAPRTPATAYYQMYCFWSGEAHLGDAEGVIATEPGFMNGAEVVKVVYNPSEVKKSTLDQHAQKAKCMLVKNEGPYRKDKDPQYYLKKSPYKYLPLLDIQKTKINTALSKGLDPKALLSPTQAHWLDTQTSPETKPVLLYDKDLHKGWEILKKT